MTLCISVTLKLASEKPAHTGSTEQYKSSITDKDFQNQVKSKIKATWRLPLSNIAISKKNRNIMMKASRFLLLLIAGAILMNECRAQEEDSSKSVSKSEESASKTVTGDTLADVDGSGDSTAAKDADAVGENTPGKSKSGDVKVI